MDIKKLIESLDEFLEPATVTDNERKNLAEVAEVFKKYISFDKEREVGAETQGTFEIDFEKEGKPVGHCEIIKAGIRIRLFDPELNIVAQDAFEAEEKLKEIL